MRAKSRSNSEFWGSWINSWKQVWWFHDVAAQSLNLAISRIGAPEECRVSDAKRHNPANLIIDIRVHELRRLILGWREMNTQRDKLLASMVCPAFYVGAVAIASRRRMQLSSSMRSDLLHETETCWETIDQDIVCGKFLYSPTIWLAPERDQLSGPW
jgi:hypothetical protein